MAPSLDSASHNNEPGWWLGDEHADAIALATRQRAIIGCILGMAVGDALGLPYEGLSPRRAQRLLGPPTKHRFLFDGGMISDDTEHASLVAEALLASGDESHFDAALARALRKWFRLIPAGVGFATLRACIKLNLGFSSQRSGVYSAGNGPCMRSVILGAAVDDLEQLQRLVLTSTRMTHTDPKAYCGALAIALAARSASRQQEMHLDRLRDDFARLCLTDDATELRHALEKAARSVERREPSMMFAASLGLANGVSGYVNQTVPVVLHASYSHPNDFRSAVESAISCGGDADTTAALAGGIVGAAVGKPGVPADWLNGVRDWPRTLAWMESLACRVASGLTTVPVCCPLKLSTSAVLLRNVLFAGVVLVHGFRRLLPPY